jgi:hypothetical protein
MDPSPWTIEDAAEILQTIFNLRFAAWRRDLVDSSSVREARGAGKSRTSRQSSEDHHRLHIAAG